MKTIFMFKVNINDNNLQNLRLVKIKKKQIQILFKQKYILNNKILMS